MTRHDGEQFSIILVLYFELSFYEISCAYSIQVQLSDQFEMFRRVYDGVVLPSAV